MLYIAASPLGLVGGAGLKLYQANKQFEEIKEQVRQSLTGIAEEQSRPTEQTVRGWFNACREKVAQLLEDDLQARV